LQAAYTASSPTGWEQVPELEPDMIEVGSRKEHVLRGCHDDRKAALIALGQIVRPHPSTSG